MPCLAKRAQECVAVRADLDAAMSSERGADEAAVGLQRVRVGVTSEVLEQPRRAFDVREQQCHDAARKNRHDAPHAARSSALGRSRPECRRAASRPSN
jgi:hypothetical protein